jgi:hypothetical protein
VIFMILFWIYTRIQQFSIHNISYIDLSALSRKVYNTLRSTVLCLEWFWLCKQETSRIYLSKASSLFLLKLTHLILEVVIIIKRKCTWREEKIFSFFLIVDIKQWVRERFCDYFFLNNMKKKSLIEFIVYEWKTEAHTSF